MSIPFNTTFKGLPRSDALLDWIQQWVDRLERHHPQLLGGHVTVEAPHRHHRQGRRFHVRIVLDLAGEELVVSRSADQDGAHENAFVAVRDAFRAARRRLEDRVEIGQEARP